MANLTGILKEAGAGRDRVTQANLFLTQREDLEEMNRVGAAHFPDGRYRARTTCVVHSLPRPNFLLEIACVAVLVWRGFRQGRRGCGRPTPRRGRAARSCRPDRARC